MSPLFSLSLSDILYIRNILFTGFEKNLWACEIVINLFFFFRVDIKSIGKHSVISEGTMWPK